MVVKPIRSDELTVLKRACAEVFVNTRSTSEELIAGDPMRLNALTLGTESPTAIGETYRIGTSLLEFCSSTLRMASVTTLTGVLVEKICALVDPDVVPGVTSTIGTFQMKVSPL